MPPTNNAAERALRSGVIARKVSQCSKTQEGADSYAMIKSVVETAKRHAQHPMDVLVSLQVRAAPR
ncbi:IS66 family transposase [Deinococcus hopiensis]|uniref:IS66 family transposase n=1 Tax=Deinococcus hopiensis TaxID=309885 RepID=UPI003CCBAA49